MRLFFALWPPAEVAQQLAEIARSATDQFEGRPTRQESVHLTLAFLGEVSEERLPLLIQTAQIIRAAPFVLNIDSLGYWHHNHLLWAGNATPCVALGELVNDLQMVLSNAGFAVDGQNRIFTPHITLVRKFPQASAPLTLPVVETICWPCSRFVLVRSKGSESGSSYQIIYDFSLRQY